MGYRAEKLSASGGAYCYLLLLSVEVCWINLLLPSIIGGMTCNSLNEIHLQNVQKRLQRMYCLSKQTDMTTVNMMNSLMTPC